MSIGYKESRIANWWIASENSKMTFVNIFAKEPLNGTFFVVGYLDDGRKLVFSEMNVVKITKKGVVTSNKTFYPFEEAHSLYLKFLVEANKEGTIIATNWSYCDEEKNKMIADIISGEEVQKDVEFDFELKDTNHIVFLGYSEKLASNIVVANFDRREDQISLFLEFDIHVYARCLQEEFKNDVKKVKGIFSQKTSKRCIPVLENK